MGELEGIRKEFERRLEELDGKHQELDKVKTETQMSRQEETSLRNGIISISKKVKDLQEQLEDYLFE